MTTPHFNDQSKLRGCPARYGTSTSAQPGPPIGVQKWPARSRDVGRRFAATSWRAPTSRSS